MAAETHVDKFHLGSGWLYPEQCNVHGAYVGVCPDVSRTCECFSTLVLTKSMDRLRKEPTTRNGTAIGPTNPYSASKAASEDICLSYENTFKVPVIITNLMNVYGERQYVEKFIPLVMKKILKGETVSIHTERDGKTPGSRFYIHARNVAAAVLFILSMELLVRSTTLLAKGKWTTWRWPRR